MGHLSRTQCAKSTRYQWVDRRTWTPVASSVLTAGCWREIYAGQTDKSPRSRDGCRWANIRWPIYIRRYNGTLPGTKDTRRWRDTKCHPATLHIDSKSIRRISTMCQYKEARSVQPEQPWPALQLVLVPKPTKGLESREEAGKQVLPSIHRARWKHQTIPSVRREFGLALRLRFARVCESNISKCRSIARWTFDVIQRFERGSCHGFSALPRDFWLICQIVSLINNARIIVESNSALSKLLLWMENELEIDVDVKILGEYFFFFFGRESILLKHVL